MTATKQTTKRASALPNIQKSIEIMKGAERIIATFVAPSVPVEASKQPVVFPYKTMSEAQRDRFAKIGGPEEALRFLAKGFKTIAWRKKTEAAARAREAEEDAAFGRED